MSEQETTDTKTTIEQDFDEAYAAAKAVERWLGENTKMRALVLVEGTAPNLYLRADLELSEEAWGKAVAQHLTGIGYLNRASHASSLLMYERAFDAEWTPWVGVNVIAAAGRFTLKRSLRAPALPTLVRVIEVHGFEGDEWSCMSVEESDDLAASTDDPVVLNRLHDEFAASTRAAVGGNRRTPAATLTLMAEDDDLDVRCAVAVNPATPPEVADKLMDDDEAFVRAETALRGDRTAEQLSCLAWDTDGFVRSMAATNRKTPIADLVRIASSANGATTNEAEDIDRRHGAENAALNLFERQDEFLEWLRSFGDRAADGLADADTRFAWKIDLAASFIR